MQSMGYDTETEICILNKKDVTMSRGKKDREEITNTEEVKETEVSDQRIRRKQRTTRSRKKRKKQTIST